MAHYGMGFALFFRGALVPARANFERALALYDPQRHSDQNLLGGAQDFVVSCLSHLTLSLIVLGYPDQAVTRIREALTRAQELAHPYSLVYALVHAFTIHQLRLDIQAVHEYAETMIAICSAFAREMIGFCSGIPVAIAVVCSIACPLPLLVARCRQGSHAAVDMEPDGVGRGFTTYDTGGEMS